MIVVADYSPGVTPRGHCLSARFRKRCVFRPTVTSVACGPGPNDFLSCEDKLRDARRALHLLITGGRVQYISHDGRTTSYTPAKRGDLERYIIMLEAECGGKAAHGHGCGCSGCCGGAQRRGGRAMSVSWYN